MYPENRIRGAVLATAAALMFATMGTAIKFASADVPNTLVVFFRNLFGLVFLLPWVLHNGRAALSTRRLPLLLVRSLAGLAAMYCFFFAIGRLQLAEAVLLNFTAPLFIPFIALAWLGERVHARVVGAVLAGFLGVVLILKPGMGVFSPAALVGLASGALAALTVVSVRRLSSTEPTTRIVFYYGVICTLASALPLPWTWRTPAPEAVAWLAAAGAFATAGQWLLTRAYALAPAGQVGPFTYSAVVFAAVLGWSLWGEKPDLPTLLGAALVAAAGILAMRTRAAAPIS